MIHHRFCKVCVEKWQNYNIFKLILSTKRSRKCIFRAFRGAKTQNFPFGGNHGATSGRHWVHYKPSVLAILGTGKYAQQTFVNNNYELEKFCNITLKTLDKYAPCKAKHATGIQIKIL